MNKNKNNWLCLVLFIPLLVVFFPCLTHAEDPGIGFSYRIEKPENQIDDKIGYFDLMMTPNQEQIVKITLTNLSDEEQIIETILDSAKTNSNGVIEYNQTKIDKDESLAIDFNNIVSTEKEIVLQPKETKTLELIIKMPEIAYEGIVAGGLTLKAKEKEATDQQTNGSRVKNEYAYVIAMLLRENNDEVAPNLDYRKTYAADRNYNNTIYTRIANSVPMYQKNMTLEAQITKSGNQEILYEARQTGIQMAPNSFIDFPISMNNEEMVPGMYIAKVKAYIGSQTWSWEETFEITKKEANKYNEKNSFLTQEKIEWSLIIILVVSFISIVGIVTVVCSFVLKKKKTNRVKKRKLKSDL